MKRMQAKEIAKNVYKSKFSVIASGCFNVSESEFASILLFADEDKDYSAKGLEKFYDHIKPVE